MGIERVMARSQKGVALVQVLITTTIIMLLMLFFLTAAKRQVDGANALKDKTQAFLSHYSTRNAVLYRLMTSSADELRAEGWNFYGKPFKANEDATVSIQDLNGLISLANLSDPRMLSQLLQYQLPEGEAQMIAAGLIDWIDKDDFVRPAGAESDYYNSVGTAIRNGPIQTFTELDYIRGMNDVAKQLLITSTTIHPTPYFNPMVAPEKTLGAYLNTPQVARDVVFNRGSSSYTRASVQELTGLTPEDGIDYITGPYFRITIHSKVADSYYGKVLEYGVFPRRRDPLVVLSRLPQKQLTGKSE